MSPVPTVGWAMVLLTSGIVDDAWIADPVSPQYYSMGFGSWVWNLGEWGVGDGLAHCWALRNQAQAMDEHSPGLMLFLCASFAAGAPMGAGGVGGRVVCHLNSGREHLAMHS